MCCLFRTVSMKQTQKNYYKIILKNYVFSGTVVTQENADFVGFKHLKIWCQINVKANIF